jgi:hypothetical protein
VAIAVVGISATVLLAEYTLVRQVVSMLSRPIVEVGEALLGKEIEVFSEAEFWTVIKPVRGAALRAQFLKGREQILEFTLMVKEFLDKTVSRNLVKVVF